MWRQGANEQRHKQVFSFLSLFHQKFVEYKKDSTFTAQFWKVDEGYGGDRTGEGGQGWFITSSFGWGPKINENWLWNGRLEANWLLAGGGRG